MEPKRPSTLRNYRKSMGITARRFGEYFGVDWKQFLSEKYRE